MPVSRFEVCRSLRLRPRTNVRLLGGFRRVDAREVARLQDPASFEVFGALDGDVLIAMRDEAHAGKRLRWSSEGPAATRASCSRSSGAGYTSERTPCGADATATQSRRGGFAPAIAT